jgi:hypothetical protein
MHLKNVLRLLLLSEVFCGLAGIAPGGSRAILTLAYGSPLKVHFGKPEIASDERKEQAKLLD